MPSEYTPRLSVAIDEEDALALRNHLPIGFQKVIFNLIVKDLIALFKKYGANQVIAAFCNKDLDLTTICKLSLGGKDGNDTGSRAVDSGDVRRSGSDVDQGN